MTLDRAYVDDLRELATEQCKETVTHVVDMLVPQGVAYSDLLRVPDKRRGARGWRRCPTG